MSPYRMSAVLCPLWYRRAKAPSHTQGQHSVTATACTHVFPPPCFAMHEVRTEPSLLPPRALPPSGILAVLHSHREGKVLDSGL